MAPNQQPNPPPGPYAQAAGVYWQAGWRGCLPLPARAKKHPPSGFTGRDGAWPSYPDVQAWVDDREGAGNIGLRLPPDVIGVDVDQYDAKPGGFVLTELETKLGPLPPTWRATSRDDGVSGIRFYRVPTGLRWPGVLGPGIETIRHEHRYAVVWPSVHPNGGTYRWITPDGATAARTVPTIDDLPTLPDAWIHHATKGETATDQPRADLSSNAATKWLTDADSGLIPPCRRIASALTHNLTDLTAGGSRHDAALALTNRLIWLAGEGHVGVQDALTRARTRFLGAATDRADGEAEQEWDRMVTGAVRLAAAAHPTVPDSDPCDNPFAGLIPPRKDKPCAPPAGPSGTNTTPTQTAPTSSAGDANTAPPQTKTDADAADDAYELTLNRHRLAQAELERLRAARTAKRALDAEDEPGIVADQLQAHLIREQSQRAYKLQAAGAQQRPDPIILADLLATPDDPTRYRINDLWPAGGRVILAAKAKTGKSTTVGNVVRSLADGDPFLDRFDICPPDGRIVVIDNELDARQIKLWLRQQGIQKTQNVAIIPLRGKVATFDIIDPITRQEWAEQLRELNASVIILDCLRPVIDALGLSEDKDAGRVLVAFDALLSDSGAGEGMVVHHMGHNGERSRGDTRIRDWPDAEWRLLRQPGDDGEEPDQGAPSFFTAYGRDVNVPEGRLEYEHTNRHLSLAGGDRKEAKLAPAVEAVLDVVEDQPGVTWRGIQTVLDDSDWGRDVIRAATSHAVKTGQITIVDGPRKSHLHYISDTTARSARECADSASRAVAEQCADPPFRGSAPAHSQSPSGTERAGSPLNDPLTQNPNDTFCKSCGTHVDDTYILIGQRDCPHCYKPLAGRDT